MDVTYKNSPGSESSRTAARTSGNWWRGPCALSPEVFLLSADEHLLSCMGGGRPAVGADVASLGRALAGISRPPVRGSGWQS